MKYLYLMITILISVFLISCGGSESSENNKCSADNPTGTCADGEICNLGKCVSKSQPCGVDYPDGYCDSGMICASGTCVDENACSSANKEGECASSGEFCEAGICKPNITQYKLGMIQRGIVDGGTLTMDFHFVIMDVNGRNKHQITNDIQSCQNQSSCWVSPDYKYFLYLKNTGSAKHSLFIAQIPDNFKIDYTQEKEVAENFEGEPYFLKKEPSFIYNNNGEVKELRKYNMETEEEVTIMSFPANPDTGVVRKPTNLTVSPDEKTLVYDIDRGYDNLSDIYKKDLTNLTADPVVIYRYSKQTAGGQVKSIVVSPNNEEVAMMSLVDIQHRLYIFPIDGSALLDDGGVPAGAGTTDGKDPLGKFMGPNYNACDEIEGEQICDIKSELNYSLDGKSLFLAGQVSKSSETFDQNNLYRYDIEEKHLVRLTTEETDIQNAPLMGIKFNIEAGAVAYVLPRKSNTKNYEPYYTNLFSAEGIENTSIATTSDARELKIFFLKR